MTLHIHKAGNYSLAITDLFNNLGFRPRGTVFIKPNLSGRHPVMPGENSSIAVMDALLGILLSYECKVTIGHGELLGSPDNHIPFIETLRSSGFDRYLSRQDVTVVNLDEYPRSVVASDEMVFHLPSALLDGSFDTYINLAKIKSHMQSIVSLSLKNQMGLPAALDRALMHKTGLERCIARLATIIKPHISILEGCPAMEGDGPHHGTPRDLSLLAAGTDMVELDSCVATLVGFKTSNIPHLCYAAEYGAGRFVDNETLASYERFVVTDYLPASLFIGSGRTVRAWPTYACSRCNFVVERAGLEIKRYPFKYWRFILRTYFGRPLNIIMGRADQASFYRNDTQKDQSICIGSCTRPFAQKHGYNCLDKCPPTIDETLDYFQDEDTL